MPLGRASDSCASAKSASGGTGRARPARRLTATSLELTVAPVGRTTVTCPDRVLPGESASRHSLYRDGPGEGRPRADLLETRSQPEAVVGELQLASHLTGYPASPGDPCVYAIGCPTPRAPDRATIHYELHRPDAARAMPPCAEARRPLRWRRCREIRSSFLRKSR